MRKRGLCIDVLTAARQRISRVFDSFPRISCSFSGGKDSGVLLELVADEARKRGRRFGLLFVDLEAQYRLTIDYVAERFAACADVADPYWLALPISLRNAVSQFEPQWLAWDPERRDDWVRQPHWLSETDPERFRWYVHGMEFEDLVPAFNRWYAQGEMCASLVGIRSDESLNRWRTIAAGKKRAFEGLRWTTWGAGSCVNAYPIYDWRTEDVWTYYGKSGRPYNRLYDRMHAAGLTIHQSRICQPYGDDQRKGLWLFQVIEPETWGRVVARVNGANQGALYARESGNVLGRLKVTKPDGHTWESFARLLLESMPERTREHFENKIAVFLMWYRERGYPNGIPDEGSATSRTEPSWTRICKAILRNDYWCKGLSFSQHKTAAYENYRRLMRRRREEWSAWV